MHGELHVGMQVAEEWRWTRRGFKGVAGMFSGDSGIGKGSVRFCFEGLGSEDMGAYEELMRAEGELTT